MVVNFANRLFRILAMHRCIATYSDYTTTPWFFKLLNRKVPVFWTGLGFFYPSTFETARPKDGWTGLWLTPCFWCSFELKSSQNSEKNGWNFWNFWGQNSVGGGTGSSQKVGMEVGWGKGKVFTGGGGGGRGKTLLDQLCNFSFPEEISFIKDAYILILSRK